MRVWRMCRQPYVSHALDGLGGLYASGRWHRKGVPIVYTATSAALAALEVLVHVDPLTAPADLRLLTLDLPAECSTEVVEIGALPKAWADVPAPPELQLIGADWLRRAQALALSVPSAVIPMERNILINPLHPDASSIQMISDEPFSFDPRLLGGA
jgi:RES domain-containing protein